MLQATLGLDSLANVTNNSFQEYSKKELKELYDSLRAILEQ